MDMDMDMDMDINITINNNKNKNKNKNINININKYIYTYLTFVIIWLIFGIIAFITSLICFGKNSSMTEKIIGLLLAIFFGPFYFIFFFFNDNYCKV